MKSDWVSSLFFWGRIWLESNTIELVLEQLYPVWGSLVEEVDVVLATLGHNSQWKKLLQSTARPWFCNLHE